MCKNTNVDIYLDVQNISGENLNYPFMIREICIRIAKTVVYKWSLK